MTQDLWLVYLLECRDGSLYCGATSNLEKRIQSHNLGKASKYTRGRLPARLVGKSIPMARGDALSLEARIKKLSKENKIAALAAAGKLST